MTLLCSGAGTCSLGVSRVLRGFEGFSCSFKALPVDSFDEFYGL